MSIMRNIDEKLMRLLTYNLWYHDLDNRPQTKIAVMVTIVAILITVSMIGIASLGLVRYMVPIAIVLCSLVWLSTLYHWRLWYRLRKRKIKHEE